MSEFEIMERVLERELMEDDSQVNAYSDADFEVSDNNFIYSLKDFILSKGVDQKELKTIVDLGCGPGNITERLAILFPDAHVIGIDGSDLMIAKAMERKIKFHKYSSNLNYICGKLDDRKILSILKYKSIDLIVSNSCLHHIPDPNSFWNSIKLIANIGVMHFHRDLRRPLSKSRAKELMELYLTNSPPVLKRDYIASLCAAFTLDEVRAQLDHETLRNLYVRKIKDRYLEIAGTI